MFDSLLLVLKKPEAFAQVLAAIIGVSGLAFTFIVTYFKTKAFQKSEKIAEARLSIYLDLVEKYTSYINFLYLNEALIDAAHIRNQKIDYFLNFLTSCNKAYIVCTSKTKDELDKGYNYIYLKHNEIDKYGLSSEERKLLIKEIEKKAMEMSLLMREEIGVLDDRKLEQGIIQRNFG
ncbi:hypothetical protein [Acinetobacter pittii]|uniref:hypothetical protein n=1 Tax=Acinetobacter pittii TaxID=48296 RepID=UPI001EE573DC|nr:hypothetical protein [Acinetobacter pittii]MCG5226778.1 hypothetical protein [Acinetobacter pittii]